jgi:hypothetical protein
MAAADVKMLLSRETAREVAFKVKATLQDPTNAAKLDNAQAQASGDISKFFVICIPMAQDMLASTLQEYNLPDAMSLMAELMKHKEDPEILQIANELKARFVPGGFPVHNFLPKQPGDEMAD